MSRKNKKIFYRVIWNGVQGIFLFALFFLQAPLVAAEPQGKKEVEMTPGPRMIRAVEALANDYLAAREVLKLSVEQEERIRQEVASFKKDLWKKEAVLRVEAYDLLKEPIIDTEKTREAMERTAQLEGIFFPKLSEVSRKLEGIPTPPQRTKLAEIRKESPRGSAAGPFTATREESLSFLDQAEKLSLSRPQIEKLVALETAAARHARLDEAQLKIEHLELEDRLRRGASDEEIAEQTDRITRLVADIEKDRLVTRVSGLKILDENQRVGLQVSSTE